MNERFDKEHSYGEVRFYLADYMPNEEQCRILMLKVLEQAVRDFCSLARSELANEQQTWEEARAFLFENGYHFRWGDWELTLESFLDILDLDVRWVREQTQKKFEARNN